MAGILGIGLRSIMTYHSAIETTAQNLENAHTPFYSRRQVEMVESMFNNGVQIADVRRVFDDVSNSHLLNCRSQVSGLQSSFDKLNDIEKLLDNDASSINRYLSDSMSSIQELCSQAGSLQSRSAYLAQLTSLSNKVRDVGNAIDLKRTDIDLNLENSVTNVNHLIEEIGKINYSLSQLQSGDKNSLLDQRNALVHQLSESININYSTDDNDIISIALNNGLEIISTTGTQSLHIEDSVQYPGKVRLLVSNGMQSTDATNLISSGEIHSLMQIRNERLSAVSRDLGRLTLAIMDRFNAQNKLGCDMEGNIGGNIFADINATAMMQNRVVPFPNNTGTGNITVSVSDVSVLTASDYQLGFTDPTHYYVTRLSDQQAVASGTITAFPTSIDFDGVSVSVTTGTYQTGDKYLLSPTKNAMQNCTVTMTNPTRLALGFPVSAEESTSNFGTGHIKIDSVTDTSNASFSISKQLNPPLTIEFLTDTSYQIVNANTSAVLEGPIVYDPSSSSVFPTTGGFDPGYRVSFTGAIKAGDKFQIKYNTNIAGDNRNANSFLNLYSDKIIENSKLSFADAYQVASITVSQLTNVTQLELNSATALFDQAEQRFTEISGVSNIEEITNLSQYQEAYQASAQVIQAAKTVFDVIIGIMR